MQAWASRAAGNHFIYIRIPWKLECNHISVIKMCYCNALREALALQSIYTISSMCVLR